jgi:hypothetical protein
MQTRTVSREVASDSTVREPFRFVSFAAFGGRGLRNAFSFRTDRTWALPSPRQPFPPCPLLARHRRTPQGRSQAPLGGAQKTRRHCGVTSGPAATSYFSRPSSALALHVIHQAREVGGADAAVMDDKHLHFLASCLLLSLTRGCFRVVWEQRPQRILSGSPAEAPGTW